MQLKYKKFLYLIIWIIALLLIGYVMGQITKLEIGTWYVTLKKSYLTPPNYVFGIAWTILYILIAICGWLIWDKTPKTAPQLPTIKKLYIIQLVFNWLWTPLFFGCHAIELSLILLLAINILVIILIYFLYKNIKLAAIIMTPYLIWILFAAYLNLYICLHN